MLDTCGNNIQHKPGTISQSFMYVTVGRHN